MRRILAGAAVVQRSMKVNDELCCLYLRRLLAELYGPAILAHELDSLTALWVGEKAWGPVIAADRAGLAESLTLPPAKAVPKKGRLHACQGWHWSGPALGPDALEPSAQGGEGHSFGWWSIEGGDGLGVRIDSAGRKWRPAPGPQLRGPVLWSDIVAEFSGGVAAAVLRPIEA